jgi:hypothetical protein
MVMISLIHERLCDDIDTYQSPITYSFAYMSRQFIFKPINHELKKNNKVLLTILFFFTIPKIYMVNDLQILHYLNL